MHKYTILFGVLGVVIAILTIMSQTSYQVAITNILSWRGISEWINNPSIETITGLLVILKFCLLVIVAFYVHKFIRYITKKQNSQIQNNICTPNITEKRVTFDYSNNNGAVFIGKEDKQFNLSFSKASNTSIHFYSSKHSNKSNCIAICRVKNIEPSSIIKFDDYDSSSSVYTIRLGEYFIAKNPSGYYLQGKIISLKDDSSGDSNDEIIFDYIISKEPVFTRF